MHSVSQRREEYREEHLDVERQMKSYNKISEVALTWWLVYVYIHVPRSFGQDQIRTIVAMID